MDHDFSVSHPFDPNPNNPDNIVETSATVTFSDLNNHIPHFHAPSAVSHGYRVFATNPTTTQNSPRHFSNKFRDFNMGNPFGNTIPRQLFPTNTDKNYYYITNDGNFALQGVCRLRSATEDHYNDFYPKVPRNVKFSHFIKSRIRYKPDEQNDLDVGYGYTPQIASQNNNDDNDNNNQDELSSQDISTAISVFVPMQFAISYNNNSIMQDNDSSSNIAQLSETPIISNPPHHQANSICSDMIIHSTYPYSPQKCKNILQNNRSEWDNLYSPYEKVCLGGALPQLDVMTALSPNQPIRTISGQDTCPSSLFTVAPSFIPAQTVPDHSGQTCPSAIVGMNIQNSHSDQNSAYTNIPLFIGYYPNILRNDPKSSLTMNNECLNNLPIIQRSSSNNPLLHNNTGSNHYKPDFPHLSQAQQSHPPQPQQQPQYFQQFDYTFRPNSSLSENGSPTDSHDPNHPLFHEYPQQNNQTSNNMSIKTNFVSLFSPHTSFFPALHDTSIRLADDNEENVTDTSLEQLPYNLQAFLNIEAINNQKANAAGLSCPSFGYILRNTPCSPKKNVHNAEKFLRQNDPNLSTCEDNTHANETYYFGEIAEVVFELDQCNLEFADGVAKQTQDINGNSFSSCISDRSCAVIFRTTTDGEVALTTTHSAASSYKHLSFSQSKHPSSQFNLIASSTRQQLSSYPRGRVSKIRKKPSISKLLSPTTHVDLNEPTDASNYRNLSKLPSTEGYPLCKRTNTEITLPYTQTRHFLKKDLVSLTPTHNPHVSQQPFNLSIPLSKVHTPSRSSGNLSSLIVPSVEQPIQSTSTHPNTIQNIIIKPCFILNNESTIMSLPNDKSSICNDKCQHDQNNSSIFDHHDDPVLIITQPESATHVNTDVDQAQAPFTPPFQINPLFSSLSITEQSNMSFHHQNQLTNGVIHPSIPGTTLISNQLPFLSTSINSNLPRATSHNFPPTPLNTAKSSKVIGINELFYQNNNITNTMQSNNVLDHNYNESYNTTSITNIFPFIKYNKPQTPQLMKLRTASNGFQTNPMPPRRTQQSIVRSSCGMNHSTHQASSRATHLYNSYYCDVREEDENEMFGTIIMSNMICPIPPISRQNNPPWCDTNLKTSRRRKKSFFSDISSALSSNSGACIDVDPAHVNNNDHYKTLNNINNSACIRACSIPHCSPFTNTRFEEKEDEDEYNFHKNCDNSDDEVNIVERVDDTIRFDDDDETIVITFPH